MQTLSTVRAHVSTLPMATEPQTLQVISSYMSLRSISLTFKPSALEWATSILRSIRSRDLASITIGMRYQYTTQEQMLSRLDSFELEASLATSTFLNQLKRVQFWLYCTGPQDEGAWKEGIARSLSFCSHLGVLAISLHECEADQYLDQFDGIPLTYDV